MRRHFDGTIENDDAPQHWTGKVVFDMVKNIKVVFGKPVKGVKKTKAPTRLRRNPFSIDSLITGQT